MPKAIPPPVPPNLTQAEKVVRNKRLSLQQEVGRSSSPSNAGQRRNTIQIEDKNTSKNIRKSSARAAGAPQPTISEEEEGPDGLVDRQPKKNSEVAFFTIEESRKPTSKRNGNGKVNYAYDDGFSNKLMRSSSVNGSIKSGASKQGSVQSLEVVREQYCCLQRKTKLERILIVVVFVLSIVVFVLIVVIMCLARKDGLQRLTDMVRV